MKELGQEWARFTPAERSKYDHMAKEGKLILPLFMRSLLLRLQVYNYRSRKIPKGNE